MRELGDEELNEILQALDIVERGPWKLHKFKHESLSIRSNHMVIVDIPGYGLGSRARLAEHIARCDPDTIRSIVTELLAARKALR